MERIELEQLVRAQQEQVQRLERRQSRIFVIVLALFALFLLPSWQRMQARVENLKTRALSIVDSKGVVRFTIGAPVPNPVIDGKIHQRRSPATGIIFNDSGGNERGGIAMLDDGSMNLCFDDAKVERNCFFLMPRFGNGVALNDVNGESRAILYLDTSGSPHLLMRDDKGQTLVSLPEMPKQASPTP